MGQLGKVMAGIVVSLGLVGCGEAELDSGTIPFKNTDTSQFETLKEQMSASVKKKDYAKRPAAPSKTKEKGETKAEEKAS